MGQIDSPSHGIPPKKFRRTQRHPQYSPHEMQPFFAEVAKGYCWKQSADRAKMVRDWVNNTLYSDDDLLDHLLDLAIVAGAEIRTGQLAAPDRYDGLYDKFKEA